jgi:hypothetical protein
MGCSAQSVPSLSKTGDAVLGLDEVRRAVARDLLDERHDGLLRGPGVPGWKRIVL